MKILYIPADPKQPVEAREIEPTLDVMSKLVGGYLQVVGLVHPFGSLYIDEEGKLKRKPFNQRATALVQRHNQMLGDFIVGDAFVCGGPDKQGNDTSVHEEYLRLADD